MARDLAFLLGCIALLAGTRYGMSAQVADSKIAALDSLSAAERHARLVEGARAEAEARAGKLAADVIMSGELGILLLIDRGVMARYRSPQLVAYPESFRDKDSFWNVNLLNVLVPAYNSRLVNKDEAPQRLEDLLRARWKGKLAMDSQSYYWFGALLQHMGEEAAARSEERR